MTAQRGHRFGEFARFEGLDHGRVHIALAAHGGRIAQQLRHFLDRADHELARLDHGLPNQLGALKPPRARTIAAGQSMSERVLRYGEIGAGDLAQIVVDIRRRHRMPRAVRVEILKQVLSREIHAAPDDPGDARVAHRHVVLDAALAAKLKAQGAGRHLQMLLAQGREAVGAVVAGIFLAADADQRRVEQTNHRREHLVARHAVEGEIARHAGAQLRQVQSCWRRMRACVRTWWRAARCSRHCG